MSEVTPDRATVQRRSIGARRNPATETAILDAAEAILTEKGPRGLSMEAVARRAKAGKATLYKWWPNRGALLIAVYERSKGDHQHHDAGDLVATVAAFYKFVFDFWRTPAGQVFALIIAEAQSDAAVADALARYRAERLEALREVVDRSRTRGELCADIDSSALAELIMAAAWMKLLTGALDADPKALAQAVVGTAVV
nr:TetR/AcrR family transcriptional regulator [uncultured Celeribacter sp.]